MKYRQQWSANVWWGFSKNRLMGPVFYRNRTQIPPSNTGDFTRVARCSSSAGNTIPVHQTRVVTWLPDRRFRRISNRVWWTHGMVSSVIVPNLFKLFLWGLSERPDVYDRTSVRSRSTPLPCWWLYLKCWEMYNGAFVPKFNTALWWSLRASYTFLMWYLV